MKGRTIRILLILSVGILVLLVSSCPNSLSEVIDEEVKVVVTPPSILSVYPEVDTVGFDVEDEILIVFSKNIDSGSINSSSFIIKDSEGTTVSGRYSVSNDTIAFTPNADLHYSTIYTVTAKKNILDIDGNELIDEYSWSFTSEEAPSSELPQITNFRIDYGRSATNTDTVTLDITATNAENVTGDMDFHYREVGAEDWSPWITLTDGNGTVTDVSIDITEGVASTFNFEAEVRNTFDNKSSIVTDSIDYETEPPTVTATTPERNSFDYPSNGGVVSISFSEEIDPNTLVITADGVDGNFYLMEGTTRIEGTAVQYLLVDSTGVYPDNTALLTGLELDQGVDYMVYLEATVTDTAGNYLESDYSWFFRTGDAIDTEPPVGSILLNSENYPSKHPTETATNDEVAELSISASDEYNLPYGMKIWGDNNDINLPAFEDAAQWEPYTTSKQWTLSPGDGYKYIYYKFMDSASNETETPYRVKLSLDTTPPIINGVYIDGDATYTNDPERMVILTTSAIDATSGLARMRVIVDGTYLELDPDDDDDDGDLQWGSWIPSMEIQLSEGDDEKSVGVEVRDYVGLPLAPVPIYDTIILDQTPPEISFTPSDQLIINSPDTQNGTFFDDNPIDSYLWEQTGGPGTISFSDETLQAPEVSADTEGEYTLKVTATDAAGNSTFNTINMIWDITAPGTPAGTAPVVAVDNYYSAANQPEWSWAAVDGADFYKVSFAESPDWETPDATGQTGYIITQITSFTPPDGLADGVHTLKVKACDYAGNSTSEGSDAVLVDTTFPVIENDGAYFLKNESFLVNNTSNISDGEGSDIASVMWAQFSGDGTLTFSNANAMITTISADIDDYYTISLTVTDNAGNTSIAYYGLNWDTTGPAAPSIFAPSSTPDSTPTWVWESTGDGIGHFRYEFIDRNGDSTGWIDAEDVYSFTAPDQGSDQYTLTLNIQDQDEVGNWSDTSTKDISVDTTNIVAPFINAPSLTNDSTPTWTWSSGAGADPSATYQWKLDAGDWSTNTSQTSYTPVSALGHGNHILYVQEYFNLVWRESSYTIYVDLVAPTEPTVNMTQTGTSTSITNDTTPNFTWSSGGGGNGVYQYQYQINSGGFNGWSGEVTSKTFTYTSALSHGDVFELQVRERDVAGNWSNAGSKEITIDTVDPVPGTISIDSGALYTRDLSVNLSFSATEDPTEMQFCNYSSSEGWGIWSDWQSYSPSKTWTLTSGDETKYALVRFKDSAGNVSGYIYDTIVLDTIAPTVTSFSINNNAKSTSSSSINLNSAVSGASKMYVKNGPSSLYTEYNYSESMSWSLTSGYGVKLVQIYYEDAAGNTTSVYTDVIHYGQSNLYNSTKGETNNGYIYLNYDAYGTESGSNTYYAYFHTAPTSTPSSGYALVKTSTSTSPGFSGIPKGTLYYVYIMVYNNSAGLGLSDRYGTPMIAFSSDITVVYDSNMSSDITTANNIKTLLEDSDFDTTTSGVSGTMPVWTVTLLPENQIPNSWTTVDDRYIIYGDPIIITPHASYPYSYSNRARNLAHRSANTGQSPTTTAGKAGIVAMGYGGNLFLYRLRLNPSWHWQGTMSDTYQYPTEIGYGYSTGFNTGDVHMYQWTAGNSTWSSPLASSYFNGGTDPIHNVTSQVTYTSAPLAVADTTDSYYKRWSVYRATDTNPTYGYIYGGDYPNVHYFPVIRQGRFLQFGFQTMPTRPYTGKVYFINLIARMDNY